MHSFNLPEPWQVLFLGGLCYNVTGDKVNKLEAIKAYAKLHRIPIIQDEGLAFLLDFITVNDYHQILELGSAIGYSAIQMALVADDNQITTIEREEELFQVAKQNISDLKLDHRIRILHMDAYDFEPNMQYDFIFIDAAKAQYRRLFEKYYPSLRRGGACLFDNMEFHGLVAQPELSGNRNTRQLARKLKEFRNYIENNSCFKAEYYADVGDGILVVYQKENVNETCENRTKDF